MQSLQNIFSENNKTYKNVKRSIFDWMDVVVTSIIAVVVIFTFVFRVATIDGTSMQDTLFHGEKVILTNWGYTPKAGDIVVVSRNAGNNPSGDKSQTPIIKRVIATAGQTVDIDYETNTVYVDGNPIDEPYIKNYRSTTVDPMQEDRVTDPIEFPLIVKEGYIFCMGDNRNNSLDGRSKSIGENGLINTRYVLGHASFRIFPFNKIGSID